MKTLLVNTLPIIKEREMLLRLKDAGLNNNLVKKIINSNNNNLAVKIVELIRNGGLEPLTNQKRARKIMRSNMFGIEEAIKYFGVTPSKRQLAILADIPFSERVLEACKETHILVALFPLSILDLYRRVRDLDWTRYPLFCKNHQFRGNTYAKKRGKTQWGLIRKNPVKNSTYNNWDKQQALLDKDEETPQAQVMVYTILGHHLNTGEQLFLENDIRCSDSDRHRYSHVCISYCDCLYAEGDYLEGDERYNGLCVQFNYDDDSHVCIGLSAARKLSSQALSF